MDFCYLFRDTIPSIIEYIQIHLSKESHLPAYYKGRDGTLAYFHLLYSFHDNLADIVL
jgi:hypothetical protein